MGKLRLGLGQGRRETKRKELKRPQRSTVSVNGWSLEAPSQAENGV